MPGQKFCNVLEKVFTILSFRFVGENNQDTILYEFSMVHSSNLCSLYIYIHIYIYIYIYLNFSFIYARILIYFQLIAHLLVKMYITTCAACLVEY